MRRLANPPNPYETMSCEWLGPPPEVALEVYEETARSVLSENDSPDVGFRWSVNPYRGCQHACAYCYARPTHEYLGMGAGTDFDTRISVKVNAPELLSAALQRRGWKRETLAFSGVTDCYQPLEAVYQLTRRCLQVCAEAANPATIITKSYLVVRDIDVLQALQRAARVRVLLSIPFADEAIARKIEPHAPPPARRFDAVRQLCAAGIPVGVMVAPLIPGLNDRDVPALLRQAADAGASSASYVPLRLPGSVRDVFLERLRGELPDRAKRVEYLVRSMRCGAWNDSRFGHRMRGSGPYWDGVRQLFEKMAVRFGLRDADNEAECGPLDAVEKVIPRKSRQKRGASQSTELDELFDGAGAATDPVRLPVLNKPPAEGPGNATTPGRAPGVARQLPLFEA